MYRHKELHGGAKSIDQLTFLEQAMQCSAFIRHALCCTCSLPGQPAVTRFCTAQPAGLINHRYRRLCLCVCVCLPADDALQLTAGSSPSNDATSASSSAGYQADSDTADSIASLTSLSSSEEYSGTIAERMQQQYEQKQQSSQGVVAFKQRQQRRKEYMEQAGQVRASLAAAAASLTLAAGLDVA